MPRIRVVPPLASSLPTPPSHNERVGRRTDCMGQAHMGCTATLFPTVPTAPIPPAGAQDPLAKPRSEPIVPVEPSEAPIRQLRKRTRTHNPSAPSLQPGKARKCAKKGGEKELNLDWGLVAGGKHCELKMCFTQVEFNCLNQNGRLGLKMGTRFLFYTKVTLTNKIIWTDLRVCKCPREDINLERCPKNRRRMDPGGAIHP
ncbi:hypothetical protein B0H14DRAFT_3170905 [Mycena olivaceomarginata]|nr:hypothetical protein B0H14DRAFT_3170905 [Mycena olivaceomarginata]